MAHGGTGKRVDEALEPFESEWSVRGGAAAGAVATVVMGIVNMVTDLPTLRVAIAGLYGFSGNLVAGWIAHLVHGSLFGVVFAVILADPGLHGLTDDRRRTLVAGIAYGLVLAVIGAGIVMPIWLWSVGVTPQPSIPHVAGATLTWHLVYGLVLATLFPALEDL
jgi:hypothetical protein